MYIKLTIPKKQIVKLTNIFTTFLIFPRYYFEKSNSFVCN